jgi:hypothetical protein
MDKQDPLLRFHPGTLHRDELSQWLGTEVIHEQTRQTRLLLAQLTAAASVPLAVLDWRPQWFGAEAHSLVLSVWFLLVGMTCVWWLLELQAMRRKRQAQALFQAKEGDGPKPS